MCQIILVTKYSGHMCPWCWVFPRWSASIKAILWVYLSIFTVTSTESQILFHPCTILVGDHPPVCAGEHDGGGDGGHPDHHLHRRDRPWLRFSNQFGRSETVSSGNETCPSMTLDVHIHTWYIYSTWNPAWWRWFLHLQSSILIWQASGKLLVKTFLKTKCSGF